MAEDLDHAYDDLLRAAHSAECSWCRIHVLEVADMVSSLRDLSHFSDSLENHPEYLGLLRRLGEKAESLGVLALLTKIINTRLGRWIVRLVF